MKKSISRTTAIAGAIIGTLLLSGATHADAGKCNGLSGYYGGVTAIIVGADGSTVNVILDGGRPNAYGTCSANSLTVNFSDAHVITGTHDGKTITWDNGTTAPPGQRATRSSTAAARKQ